MRRSIAILCVVLGVLAFSAKGDAGVVDSPIFWDVFPDEASDRLDGTSWSGYPEGTPRELMDPPAVAGSVTFSCPMSAKQGNMWRCTWVWTSSAGGAVSSNTKQVPYGRIVRFDTIPSGTAPDDNYDITLLDTQGIDVLLGQGANRDTANVESVTFGVDGFWHDGSRTLDLTIANAGAAKIGTLIVYIEQK